MSENNKSLSTASFFIVMFILSFFVYYNTTQLEKKMDLIWEDVTIVGDTLKAELDEIKEKLHSLESEIEDIKNTIET